MALGTSSQACAAPEPPVHNGQMNSHITVSAVLIGYDGPPEGLAQAVRSLRSQTLAPTQIICLDQSSDGRLAKLLGGSHGVEILYSKENLGYPSACNRAAATATGEYLLFLNADARADPDCVAELVSALARCPDAAIAGAQVLLPERQKVNAGDNVLHLSGLSWAGRYGLPPEEGPPRAAAVVSGAALLVRRSLFEALGGYTEGFFMYYDDVDLAWRARLAGWEVLFCPRANVVHDYEFSKGNYKWRYLERNRWWCLLAHLELRTLLALAPLLVAVEAAIWLRAAAEGWSGAKLDACWLLWASRRRLYARRREVQGARRVGDRVIVERMSATVDSPFLASRAVRRVDPFLKAYRRLVLALAC
jgi:N-acetylglucosaminyl-diphospho-decaprenol L-rhamnosyltransferase